MLSKEANREQRNRVSLVFFGGLFVFTQLVGIARVIQDTAGDCFAVKTKYLCSKNTAKVLASFVRFTPRTHSHEWMAPLKVLVVVVEYPRGETKLITYALVLFQEYGTGNRKYTN